MKEQSSNLDKSYVKRRVRQVAGEIKPTVWPLGIVTLGQEAIRARLKMEPVSYSYSKVIVPTSRSLASVMDWIVSAQQSASSGGIPAYFSLYGGYGPPYPETTGYLIPTLLNYATLTGKESFARRAQEAGNWLLSLQLPRGAFPGGFAQPDEGPSVFNSGQILFGMVALARHDWPEQEKFREAAIKVGRWLVEVQSDNGAWERHTYEGESHVYYTMVSWALAQLSQLTNEAEFAEAATRNVRWVVSQQTSNGWFEGYNLKNRPIFLHFIAYALQGMLETALLLDLPDVVESVVGPSERLMRQFEVKKGLAGAYDAQWERNADYACLTGNAQMALVWQSLYRLTGDLRFFNAALKMNELLKSKISYRGQRGIRGGVKGSDPIWGKYLAYRYPNWAAKFTADSFTQELQQLTELQQELQQGETE